MMQFWGVWRVQVDGTGWNPKRLGKGVARPLRWLCVPTGDCLGTLATSFVGPALDVGSPGDHVQTL